MLFYTEKEAEKTPMNIKTIERLTVQKEECGTQGLIRIDSFFQYMQHGAEVNAGTLHVGYQDLQSRGLFFVLARTHIEVTEMIHAGDSLIHETWPGNTSRFFFPRHHRFLSADGAILAAASSLWVTLDTKERRLVSPSRSGISFPDTSEFPAPVAIPMHIANCSEKILEEDYSPVQEDFDLNGHVNNASYVRWMSEKLDSFLTGKEFISSLTVGFEKEIRGNDPVHFLLNKNGPSFSFHVLNSAGEKHFSAGGTISEG